MREKVYMHSKNVRQRKKTFAQRLGDSQPNALTCVSIVVAILAATTGLQHLLLPHIHAAPFAFYFVATMITTLYCGPTYGVICALCSALLGNYFFLPPGNHFVVSSTGVIATGSFLVVDLCSVGISSMLRTEIAARHSMIRKLEDALVARDDFLSVAGHELRTPLTALLLRAEALSRMSVRENATWALERVEGLNRAIGNLKNLVDRLLDVSHIRSGRLQFHPESVNLGELVSDVVERFAGSSTTVSELNVDIADNVTGFWDRLRIDQVATNLIGNAIKYGLGKPIDINVRREDENAVLSVRDRGIGIALEQQATIFEKFERTSETREYGGLGLGLWISKHAIDIHGGNLRVESSPGRGSTFTACLPLRSSLL